MRLKKIFFFLIIILFFSGCEIYIEPSYPVIYMGGGKWTLIDYEVIIVQTISPITIIKSDTICVNSFVETKSINGNILLKQNYNLTPISRRFIKNKTQWEFDGYNLYCAWINGPGGLMPAHEPFWVTYPNSGLYIDHPIMEISDYTTGAKTDYVFSTNNMGVAPPNKMILTSPDIVLNLYSSSGARDKAATIKIVLTFIR